ncbi:MAG: folB [Panacagrimonas sp.]|jgi:dihydroneopterin aldolase|nr:dihydroneopterin aldolase [Panacagrimonas sp.]MCC2656265.1 folB [Panacagrimonas sp.]
MDKIFIRGLKVETIIGIYDWERTLKRPLVFDVELGCDTREAASSDRMRDSIDYAAVGQTIRDIAVELQPELLETLAEKIARTLFERFPVLSVRLTIDKPGAIPDVKGVGVEIDRRREDYAVCGR